VFLPRTVHQEVLIPRTVHQEFNKVFVLFLELLFLQNSKQLFDICNDIHFCIYLIWLFIYPSCPQLSLQRLNVKLQQRKQYFLRIIYLNTFYIWNNGRLRQTLPLVYITMSKILVTIFVKTFKTDVILSVR
jgi:hypothetical protein